MIGLYIHVPFCRRKCDYCDFYSVCDLSLMHDYTAALCRELDGLGGRFCIDTIFVGGGTPSLLPEACWRTLGAAIRRNFSLATDLEFTVECNPTSASPSLFDTLRTIGVNRISIGVQSLQPEVLAFAGRLHDAEGALSALHLANAYFDNVNFDYIVGFPQQTENTVRQDVERLAPLTQHASVYALQVEEGTPLYRKVADNSIDLPDEDYTAALYDSARAALERYGYHRYEVSNFAVDGRECRHNLHCWQYHEYLGVGAAAHGYVDGIRYYHAADVEAYVRGDITRIEEEDRSIQTAKFEMIMLGLRTVYGVEFERYKSLFGSDFRREFASLLKDSAIMRATRIEDGRFAIKEEYLYTANAVILRFLEQLS